MSKISVVIPVYNSEKTVKRCVDSVLKQTFSDIEILLVNDGSPDGSDEICRKLAETDSRIKYFMQENRGLSAVRNFGIQNAVSDYICFVDSDDYIGDGCFEFMYRKAMDTNCDIVLCGYIKESGKSVSYVSADNAFITHENINDYMIELKSKNLIDPAWNKLYKLSFIRESGVVMPEGEFYEDTAFNLNLIALKPTITVAKDCFYHYVLHMGSITRRYNPEKLAAIKERARLLKRNTQGIDSYCDYYFLMVVFSALVDMFLSCKRGEISACIKNEISAEEFKSAALNAKAYSIAPKVLIKIAKSGNTFIIYLFCRVSFIIKYKMQWLFMKVINK